MKLHTRVYITIDDGWWSLTKEEFRSLLLQGMNEPWFDPNDYGRQLEHPPAMGKNHPLAFAPGRWEREHYARTLDDLNRGEYPFNWLR